MSAEHRCLKCGELKPLAEFSQAQQRLPAKTCKECKLKKRGNVRVLSAKKLRQNNNEDVGPFFGTHSDWWSYLSAKGKAGHW